MPRLEAVSVRSTGQDETKCQHIRVISSHVCAAATTRQLQTDGDAEQSLHEDWVTREASLLPSSSLH